MSYLAKEIFHRPTAIGKVSYNLVWWTVVKLRNYLFLEFSIFSICLDHSWNTDIKWGERLDCDTAVCGGTRKPLPSMSRWLVLQGNTSPRVLGVALSFTLDVEQLSLGAQIQIKVCAVPVGALTGGAACLPPSLGCSCSTAATCQFPVSWAPGTSRPRLWGE